VDEGAKRPVRTTQPLKSTAGTPAPDARPAPAPKAAEPAPAAPVVVAPAPVPRPATATAKPAPLPESRPAPRPEAAPAPGRLQTVEIVPPPQRAPTTTPTRNVSAPDNGSRTPEPARAVESVRSSAPVAPRPAEPARAAEGGETTDGSAAVDWLLKTRR
jgi:hypothetical protein